MKILILQLKRIGDLILTTPAIRCLREAFPDAHLTLVADATGGDLVKGIEVDQCRIYDRRQPWNAWITSFPSLRADYCLDFTGTDRSAFLTVLSRSKRRVTFARFRKKLLRPWIYTDFVESSVRDRHTSDYHTDLLLPLGIERKNVPLDLSLPAATLAEGAAFLHAAGVTGPYAVLHPGTARPEKYWLPERWAEIAKFLHDEYSLHPVFTGSADAAEQEHLAKIKAALTVPVTDLSSRTNLLQLAAVIRGAQIFCGVDTAAMHLADAMRTPSVALFGPTNPFHWRPRHAPNIALRAETSEPFTPAQKGGPMEKIRVPMVTAGLSQLVTAKPVADRAG